jgi:TRAP-type uncharacterized transport system substrate-binding protein
MANKSIKFYRDLLITFAPLFVLIAIGFWVASKFIAPPVPKKITITTGHENGGYFQFAKKYRDELAKEGITLEIITSSGSLENVDRLLQNKAEVAFVQGGTTTPDESDDNLVSLGSLYYEPVWIFLNNKIRIDQLKDFARLRIATGPDGSGTQSIARVLLELNDVNIQSASFLSLPNSQAANSLLEHKIDVAFFVASAKAPVIQKLLRDDRVHLLNLDRAEAYSHLLPYLSKITLPEGVIDLHQNIPTQDITMIAPTANLVVHEDLHSALQVLLVGAAKQIHGGPSLFSNPDEFPSAHKTVFPVSEIATRYFKVGPPFLMRYLPFRAAIFIDRMVVLLIPLLALMLPLMKIMPPLYRWRVRSSIYRWYEELQEIENETFVEQLTAEKCNTLIKELERIEAEVNKVKTPLSYADQLFNLLLHIDLVKKRLKPNMQVENTTA